MSILSRIKSVFRREPEAPAAPVLRNKPGGMAWIKGVDGKDGDEVLNNRAVRTVKLLDNGFWEIDPPQDYRCTIWAHYTVSGINAFPGLMLTVLALQDDCLEPWKDTGLSRDEVAALYLPNIPMKESA